LALKGGTQSHTSHQKVALSDISSAQRHSSHKRQCSTTLSSTQCPEAKRLQTYSTKMALNGAFYCSVVPCCRLAPQHLQISALSSIN